MLAQKQLLLHLYIFCVKQGNEFYTHETREIAMRERVSGSYLITLLPCRVKP